MQLDYRFCVICLKELIHVKIQVKRGRKRKDEGFKRRKNANSIKLLLTYLLSGRSRTDASVLKDILKLSGVEIDGEEGDGLNVPKSAKTTNFRLCENCEEVAERILERQLELEKLQMRIVHDVKSVKEAILRSSGWLGGIEGENGEEAFDHFSRRFCEEDVSSNARKMFEILKEFQAAVSKTGKDSILVPLVHLEQYSVPQSSQNLFAGADIVKIEAKPIISQYDGTDTGSCHEDVFPLLDDANMDVKSLISCQMDFDELDEDNNTNTILPSKYQPVKKKKTRRRKPGTKIGPCRKSKARVKVPELAKLFVRRIHKHYRCETCNGKFKTTLLSRFEQHLRGHETEKKTFSCDDCNMGFTTEQHFTFHQGQHRGYHKLICDLCKSFFTPMDLAAHMKTHVDNDTIFPCSYCSQCFASVDRLINHVHRNHKVRNGIMKCDICGDLFQTKNDMLEHLHGVHKAIEKLRCEFEGCDKTYFDPTCFRTHQEFHNGRHTCSKCLRKFYHRIDLDAHQKVHDTRKPEVFQCDQCPDTFQSSRRLQAHKMTEHGATKFSCNICGKQYISPEGLRNHRKKDHEGTGGVRCPICNKKLASSYKLRVHTEAHHSVSKNYVCEECGKAFKTLNTCQIHKKIHGDKTHFCPHCPKTFTRRDNLDQHILTHTGERPHICDCCGLGFAQQGTMKTHRRKCSIKSSSGRVDS